MKGTCPVVDDMSSNLDESSTNNHEAAIDLQENRSKHWDGTLDTHMVKEIECLTGCSISQKLDGPGLLVKGANLVDIERATGKLDVLALMIVSCRLIFILLND